MHFFKPKWVRHGRKNAAEAVYSVDVQPGGASTRLATAGGDDSVRLWSMDVIAQHARPAPPGTNVQSPRPQPSTAKVANGRMGESSHSGESDTDAAPSGALLAVLKEHTGAVNCVRWAPTGDRLASGGDDHFVLVYTLDTSSAPTAFAAAAGAVENWSVSRPYRGHTMDVTHVAWSPCGEKLASASVDNVVLVWNVRAVCITARLEGHQGFVKGVTWDPCGKFLASQADDRTVRVWRTADWRCEKILDKAFESAVYEQNRATFFLRLDWSPCGTHLCAVNARKQSNSNCAPMFAREAGFSEQIEFVGHEDAVGVARFSPRLYRPRGDVHGKPYTVLLLGSNDSSVTCWQASRVQPFFRMAEMFKEHTLDLSWSSDGYSFVACSKDGQVMFIKFTADELGDVISQEETNTLLTSTWRQFGGTLANGSAPPEYPAQLQAPKEDEEALEEDDEAEESSVEIPPPTVQQPSTPATEPRANIMQGPPQRPLEGPTPPADPQVLAAQNETRVRGKRRIVPVAVTATNGSPAAPPPGSVTIEIQEAAPTKRARVASGGIRTSSVRNGLKATYEERLGGSGAIAGVPPGAKPTAYATPLSHASVLGLSLMLLPGPNESSGRCRIISTETPPTLLEAKEEVSAAGGFSLACSRGGKVLWRDYHPRGTALVALAGVEKKFAAVAADDGALFIYSAQSGRRIAPPMVLDSAPHIMEAVVVGTGKNERWFLLVVSRAALCSVFDVREKRLVCARSAAPLLARAEEGAATAKVWRSVVRADVTPSGEPLLSLSDRHAFAYSARIGCWVRVVDDSAGNSEYARGKSRGVGGKLRALSASSGPTGGLIGMGDITRAATESLAHLECLLESAAVVQSPEDYTYYLAGYVGRIAAAVGDDVPAAEERLRELCDSLLTPHTATTASAPHIILGLDGRKLLKEHVIPVVNKARELQRVAEEYLECLTELEKITPDTENNNKNNTNHCNESSKLTP